MCLSYSFLEIFRRGNRDPLGVISVIEPDGNEPVIRRQVLDAASGGFYSLEGISE
jgi:hypothetical protein